MGSGAYTRAIAYRGTYDTAHFAKRLHHVIFSKRNGTGSTTIAQHRRYPVRHRPLFRTLPKMQTLAANSAPLGEAAICSLGQTQYRSTPPPVLMSNLACNPQSELTRAPRPTSKASGHTCDSRTAIAGDKATCTNKLWWWSWLRGDRGRSGREINNHVALLSHKQKKYTPRSGGARFSGLAGKSRKRDWSCHLFFTLASSRSRALCLTEPFPFSRRASACSASSRDMRSLAESAAFDVSRESSARAEALSFPAASIRLYNRAGGKRDGVWGGGG